VDESFESGRGQNVLGVRRWDGRSRRDSQLEELVDSLLASVNDDILKPQGDIRTVVSAINATVKKASDKPMPVFSATDSQEGYFEQYPLRPGAEICNFYVQCGYCKYVHVKLYRLSFVVLCTCLAAVCSQRHN
jgi:hypothetical protein